MDDVVQVANTAETVTPAQETTPVQETTEATTEKVAVAKEPTFEPTDTRFDKHPRFQEAIRAKNDALRKSQELEKRLAELEAKNASPQEDFLADLNPEERAQTELFINKRIAPILEKRFMEKMSPFMQEVQNTKLHKQVSEAKDLASKVGINFDERLPEITDYLSRPENRGRLTAKEALMSLYSEEILSGSTSRAREELSKETQMLNEKKKIANTSIQQVNPNSVVQTDELATRGMNPAEKLRLSIEKAIELERQGVKHPKVKSGN